MTNKTKPPRTKADTVTRLLIREKGATIEEIVKATGWQPHSCRAFLTGLRKKGNSIVREDRGDGKTAYRIAAPAAAAAAPSATPASG